ncbi:uncharacterized protein LOC106176652 isoform X2 [Lingula anatina]|uniref:Uncharacterized protein LOC106176652 isoform X2 n=1 Tax=Lingula anatina TaxID=7574 RepID=A0A1S3JW03_LINAN|nr:uncharacterized protein LOC106176652 isoform X2 [Lingula anatina]|eukprot:XP_013414585.1 uncharacterized protein LOC106176652 isoform X2 [Lingula anatina]
MSKEFITVSTVSASVYCQARKKFVCPANSSKSPFCPQPGQPDDYTHCSPDGCDKGRGEHHCGDGYEKNFYCPRPNQTVFDTICCKDANREDACCSAEGLAEWAIIVIAVVCVLVFLLCVCCICCCCCACCPCHHTRRSEYVIFRNT